MTTKTTVLFTSCCGWPTCGTISALRESTELDVTIIGCDCAPNAAALNYVDVLCKVPRCTDSSYVPTLIDICKRNNVDVLVPLISDEIGTISMSRKLFEGIGVSILLSGIESKLNIANNKLDLYRFLLRNGLDVMPRTFPLSWKSLVDDVTALGYPGKPVCVKPIDGCGSAGFRILDDAKAVRNVLDTSRASRSNPYITLEQLINAAPLHDGEFMLQEYLPGEELGTLCLVDHGRTVYSPSHRNFCMQNATAVSCELVDDPDANQIAERVNRLLMLDGNIGYDFKRNESGNLFLIDVNPRISATVSLAAKAGLNLVEMGVMHALGMDIDECIEPLYGLRLMRNYGTLYHYEGKPYGY